MVSNLPVNYSLPSFYTETIHIHTHTHSISMPLNQSLANLLILLIYTHITDVNDMVHFLYAFRDMPSTQQILGLPPMPLYRPLPIFVSFSNASQIDVGLTYQPNQGYHSGELNQQRHDLQLRKIACVLHSAQYKSDMDMQQVRELLGWGQSEEKDKALNTASTYVRKRGSLKIHLTEEQLDESDIGWLAVVVDPYNVEDLSERLRNSQRTGQLLLHHQIVLARCGPGIKDNRRIWLSAIACQTDSYPYFLQSKELCNDIQISLAFYTASKKRYLRQPPYNAASTMESLHLYLEDVKQQMMPIQEKIVGEQQQIDDLDKWAGDATFGRSLQQVWRTNKLRTVQRLAPLEEEYQVIECLMTDAM